MNNKKFTIFIITVILLIIGLQITVASTITNDTTSNSEYTDITTYQQTSTDIEYNIEEKAIDNNIKTDITNNDKNIKKDTKTIIINNETFDTYFTDTYLNDEVSDGDTLDFQGLLSGENYTMNINKSVNIISSTHDCLISLNTVSEDFFGGDSTSSFTIRNGGSYSNITGINLYNTQFFIRNAEHITINNISAIVADQVVGRGVGQTSIRDNSSFITIENSTFSTKDNGGSSTLVLAWANNCTIRNNKIIGIGNVGNLFYLTTFNVDNIPKNDKEEIDYTIVNSGNTFENNILIGPDTPASICYAIALSGTNNRIINNTVNYTGSGVNTQMYSYEYDLNTLIANNTFNEANFFTPTATTVVNNTITGYFVPDPTSIIENNTISEFRVSIDNYIVSNNNIEFIKLENSRNNITIENSSVKNITLKGSTSAVPTNIVIRNNTLENVVINGSSNVTITNNIIGELLIDAKRNNMNKNISITNNTIVNDKEYTIIVNKKIDVLNISDNYLKAANTTGNDSIYFNQISDDYIIKNPIIKDYNAYINLNVNNPIIVNESTTLTISITDENNEELNGTIIISYDNTNITLDKNEFTYTATTTGDKTITVTFTTEDELYTTSNTFNISVYEKSLTVETINASIGDIINITTRITAGNTTLTNINKGKVTFKVNGKTLKGLNGKIIYAKIVNGTATIENYEIPESWNKENITIEAVYSGSTQCEALKSGKQVMTILKKKASIQTNNINTTVGSTIFLKATVTDDDKVINTGKIVFKINGKTLKDENGKTIYLKIVNNTVSLEYTLPDSYKAKNYTITAVLISNEYDRLEDSKTLSIQ